MIKKIMVAILFVSLSFNIIGCKSSKNPSTIEDNIIKIGIFRNDTNGAYLISINQSGNINVLTGTRKNNYIDKYSFKKDVGKIISNDIFNNNFIDSTSESNKNLNVNEITEINNLIAKIKEKESININEVRKGTSKIINMVINNNIYTFYYDKGNNNLNKLLNKILEISPTKIDILSI